MFSVLMNVTVALFKVYNPLLLVLEKENLFSDGLTYDVSDAD